MVFTYYLVNYLPNGKRINFFQRFFFTELHYYIVLNYLIMKFIVMSSRTSWMAYNQKIPFQSIKLHNGDITLKKYFKLVISRWCWAWWFCCMCTFWGVSPWWVGLISYMNWNLRLVTNVKILVSDIWAAGLSALFFFSSYWIKATFTCV